MIAGPRSARDPRPRGLARSAQRRALGFSMIEVMVGIVIGMIGILVIFQMYEVQERYKRNTTTSGDAQTTGLYSMFVLQREIGNAGAGIAINAEDLAVCPAPGAAATDKDHWKQSLRPLPLVILPGANDDDSDRLAVFYSASTTIVTPALFTSKAVAGDTTFAVQSPLGFRKDDVIVAVDKSGPSCARRLVTDVSAPDATNGVVTITLDAASPATFNQGALLVNLGRQDRSVRTLFDVTNDVLRVTDLLGDAPAVPIAGNVVRFKAEYGVDTDGDDILDSWVRPTGNYAPDQLAAASAAQINNIKAVRIAIVVRGDEPDPALAGGEWKRNVFTQCPAGACGGGEDMTFTIPQDAKWGWRFRVYETVVPIRNTLWNRVS